MCTSRNGDLIDHFPGRNLSSVRNFHQLGPISVNPLRRKESKTQILTEVEELDILSKHCQRGTNSVQ